MRTYKYTYTRYINEDVINNFVKREDPNATKLSPQDAGLALVFWPITLFIIFIFSLFGFNSLLFGKKPQTLEKVYSHFFFILPCSVLAAIFLANGGTRLDITKFPDAIFYIFAFFFIAITTIHTVLFIINSLKAKLFKRKGVMLSIAFSPLFSVLVAFLMSFTALREADGTYNVFIPVLYQLLIGFPLLIIYLHFCDYAFMHEVGKVVAPSKKPFPTREANENEQE